MPMVLYSCPCDKSFAQEHVLAYQDKVAPRPHLFVLVLPKGSPGDTIFRKENR